MVDLLIKHGEIVTMNKRREIITDGAVAVDGNKIVDVGPSAEIIAQYTPTKEIDASNRLVLPGFINVHGHVSDILIRGSMHEGRSLYDWLFNIKKPAVHAMSPDDHAIASALYCAEAISGGVTTFVELPESLILSADNFDMITQTKRDVYADAGLRSIYAVTFSDNTEVPPSLSTYIQRLTAAEPDIEHPRLEDAILDTDEAFHRIKELLEQSDREKHTVWPAPEHIWTVTPEGFQRAYELADEYDVRTTTHVSESTHDEVGHLTNIEYLDRCEFLGPRTLLAHCVHLSSADVRRLSETNTKIAHNPLANLALGSGIAPVPEFFSAGVTVGLGLDNPCVSNTVSPLNDLRFAALVHKGASQDTTAVSAQKALEMSTIEAACAIGRGDDIGSLEKGKKADIVLVDLDYPNLYPRTDLVSMAIYQTYGFEVDIVVCDGDVIFNGVNVSGIADRYPNLTHQAQRAAERILDQSGIASLS